MRIYMDVCCLNRPFDDQTRAKIRIESDAVVATLSKCTTGEWVLLSSDVLDLEINKNPDEWKKLKVTELYSIAREKIEINDAIVEKALFFEHNGLKAFDSLHLASANWSNAGIFLTTDKDLLRKAERLELNINTDNPLSWFMEVDDSE